MSIKVHRKGTWRGITQLCRYLMPDAFTLVYWNALLLAPRASHLMQFFFFGGSRRDHVVDEQYETLRTGHLYYTKIFLSLSEKYICVARKVISNHEIRPSENLITRKNISYPCHPGKDLLSHRVLHVGDTFLSIREGFTFL